MTKVRRLAIAAAVAPNLRGRNRPRRLVTTIDADGKPVRTITADELAVAMLRRADIEFSTDKAGGLRMCACRRPFAGPANQKKCTACRNGNCTDCGDPLLSRKTVASAQKAGRAPRCRSCAQKANGASRKLRRSASVARRSCATCQVDIASGRFCGPCRRRRQAVGGAKSAGRTKGPGRPYAHAQPNACSTEACHAVLETATERIVVFALAHPEASAREIASSLGTSLSSTRSILSRWRAASRLSHSSSRSSLANPPTSNSVSS